MDNKKKARGQDSEKKYSQSSIDAGVYSKLETIITTLQENKNEHDQDLKPLMEFCQRGFLNQVVQSWSYYAQVNNHAMFAKSTMLLVKSIRLINQTPDLIEYGDQLIKMLLTDYLKVVYRGLNNLRGQITNPMLFLLKEVILFDNSKHIEDFISYFDFSLPSLVKIITPSKQELENRNGNNNTTGKAHKSLRLSFIEFWIVLINRTPSLLRKDLLTDNFKIMGAWFKYMDKFDSTSIMIQTITTFIESILKEKSFKRMTKTKILNEFALGKLHHMYYAGDKGLLSKVNEFFLAYGYNPESSVSFPDNCVWFEESPILGAYTSSSTGAPVTINQREFKLYNKLLFNMLKLFKPWEDDMQSTTLVKILQSNPGLVAPYCAYISSLGSHDPKMTSYWFGMTLTLGRIISLPLPPFMENIETDMIPSTSLVMENILPSSLTKTALTKTLQSDIVLVKQLGCQLLVFAFQKLEKVLDLYTRKGWNSSKASLSTSFFNNIPDLSIIVNTLNQVYSNHKDNLIVSLSLTMILRHYSQRFPNFFSVTLPSSNIYQDIMTKGSFNGIELTVLDNFLQFQEFNSSQTKWWNSSETESSLFVSLLKLASSPNSTSVTSIKICDLLQNLLAGSVIFREDLLTPPVASIVSSLTVVSKVAAESSTSLLNSIWNLLDQCVSRSVRTPYKYVTLAQDYNNISPFLMTLTEQWKYIKEESLAKDEFQLTMKWLLIFLRTMVITGEDETGVKKLVQEHCQNIPPELAKVFLDFTKINTQELNRDEYLLNYSKESSFFYYIDTLAYEKLKAISRLPVVDMDILAILFKLKLIANDETVKHGSLFKETVVILMDQIANFLFAKNTFGINNIKIYGPFFELILQNTQNESSNLLWNNIFIAQQFMLLFREIYKEDIDELKSYLFAWVQRYIAIASNADNVEISFLLSLVVTFIDTSSLLTLVQSDFTFDRNVINIIFSKIGSDCSKHIPYYILSKYLKNSDEMISPFKKLIENNQVDDIDMKQLIPLCLSNSKMIPIFNSLLTAKLITESDIEPFLKDIKDRSIAISLVKVFHMTSQAGIILTDFAKETIENCLTHLKDLNDVEFENAIAIFTENNSILSQEQIDNILVYITTEYEHKFNNVVIDFVKSIASFEEDFVIRWMNKMTLYVTKIFSDRSEINAKFEAVLTSFKSLISKVNIWDKVNNNIINSQMEAIFNSTWINDKEVLRYVLVILFTAKRNNVESERIVNMIINNQNSVLSKDKPEAEQKYMTTLALYILFNLDPSKCSNFLVQNKLVSFYNGSMDPSDKLILKMLETIETKLSSSWTNHIYTWDLLDSKADELELIGETKLFTQEKEGLVLTLRKDIIEYSIQNYVLEYPSIPSLYFKPKAVVSEKIDAFNSYFKSFQTIVNFTDNKIVYDPLFLILLTIHNKELVKTHKTEEGENKYKFEVKNFISSKLLNFIVCALSDTHNRINAIAKTLLTQMLYSLEDGQQFKGDTIYKVLLKKIIYTLEKSKDGLSELHDQEHSRSQEIVPLMWYFVSSICDILTQPSSPLYEEAFRWVLNGPLIRNNDLPMVHELMSPKYSDSINDNYYSQLSWVLNNLEAGIRTKSDFEFLTKRGMIEWLYTLLNNPYLNSRLISMVKSILYKLQRIDTGAATLITRYAALSDLDMSSTILQKDIAEIDEQLKKNNKNSKTIRKKLTLDEQLLNNKQVALGYTEIIPTNKRLREWTENETDNLNKRICDTY